MKTLAGTHADPNQPTLFSRITRGRDPAARRTFGYGVQGVGKTTFASEAPGAIFLPTEDGTRDIDCTRLPLLGSYGEVRLRSEIGVLESLREGLDPFGQPLPASATAVSLCAEKRNLRGQRPAHAPLFSTLERNEQMSRLQRRRADRVHHAKARGDRKQRVEARQFSRRNF